MEKPKSSRVGLGFRKFGKPRRLDLESLDGPVVWKRLEGGFQILKWSK